MTRYAPALLQLAIVLVGALAQLTQPVTIVDALQLIPLVGNVLLVYLVPLLGVNARSGWKTGVATAGAIAAAAIPFAAAGHITGSQIAIVLLAGLQALGAHIGVQIRKDAAVSPATPRSNTEAARAVGEPPTHTTVTQAIAATGGEYLGTPAR